MSEDLEPLAQKLEASEEYRVLRRFHSIDSYDLPEGPDLKKGCIIDVETTGRDTYRDQIIEIGMVAFSFSKQGQLHRVLGTYNQLEDPGIPLPEEVIRVTGITDEMLQGQKIQDEDVEDFIKDIDLIICHNTEFDRPFLERRFQGFSERHFACTLTQVPWIEEGLRYRSLEYLLSYFGYFYEAHRATGDAEVTLHLLDQTLPISKEKVFKVLLEDARKKTVKVWAIGAPFETKDFLKDRGYRWNDGRSGQPKAWSLLLPEEKLEAEKVFLEKEIYRGRPMNLQVLPVSPKNRFSHRI